MTSTSSTSAFDDRRPISMSFRHSQSGRPDSPHTPQHHLRSNNSSFASTSSASTSFRGEEDAIIFEFGARWLRAGFEGESTPMCVVGCGPEESRRVGDYRGWLRSNNETDSSRSQPVKADEWAGAYELWKMDVRDMDMALIDDKIERMFRETYNKYLLTDAGTSRLVLVLPSIMPHPLLSSLLSTLFSRWRFPSITLLTSAPMAVVAAGLRSGLVVDIGWAETVVSGIYEYREMAVKRSTRAMKSLLQETGRFLTRLSVDSGAAQSADEISVHYELCEEIASRFLWCKPKAASQGFTATPQQQPAEAREEDAGAADQHTISHSDATVSLPSPSGSGSTYIDLPFSKLAEPVEKVLFAEGLADCELDDEERPLPLLVYHALLSLPPDVRGTCMSRIVFIGGGSNIPGVRQRILQDVAFLVEKYGWSPVRGKVIEQQRQKLEGLRLSQPTKPTVTKQAGENETPDAAAERSTPDAQAEEEVDPIEQKIRRNNKDKDTHPPVHGVLREVESLGPWAGASLLTSLKIRGLVEIEREKYLQHGLAGASRDLEHGYAPDRRSGLRTGGDRSSWTLAGWG
ncbi:actin-like ATPase domain-containing protein [Aspergillus eucalypticola CBS 122712]|uniref:Actin-like ATPase domain-containing protein n=1 Tax=Aspergillus eucalypticola (strain CBS 122712 / IBT 29274) TaxID=1448314 RepID=A0A317UYY9_ASPEC|nr:actin-like ATPase domain-containing protein [Aspergillus eucalypticola CBS 122712]PWY66579.1 actin-like ATPase domain-containing protein [Aspergillus eucalypticola CBS 122712]